MSFSTATREINVQRVEVEKTGKRGDKGWALYRVYATEVDGTPITEVLKTFDAVNGVVQVEFEPYPKGNAQVENYTLKVVRKRNMRKPADDDRIAELESRVSDLERKLKALISAIDTPLEVNQ